MRCEVTLFILFDQTFEHKLTITGEFPVTLSTPHDILMYFFYDGFHSFNFFATHTTEKLFQFRSHHGSITIAVVHINTTYILSRQTSLLTEEAYDIATTQFVFLSLTNIYSSHSGLWDETIL